MRKTPLYFVKPPRQPDHLYVINLEEMSGFERTMIASLQGITAKDVPCIWMNVSKTSQLWLDLLVKTNGVATTQIDSPWALLGLMRDQVNGYILYNPADETSLNAATTLAGPKRAILVEAGTEQKAKNIGLPMLFNASGKDDVWTLAEAKANPVYSKKVLLEQTAKQGDGRTVCLRDYAIFADAVTCHQGATELLSDFVRMMDKQSILLGWGEFAGGREWGEDKMGSVGAKEGVLRIASDWAYNLSVLSAFYPLGEIAQNTGFTHAGRQDENVHYVTIIWTDGDNIQWMLSAFSHDPKFWASPSRGRLDMGWGINNVLYCGRILAGRNN